MKSSRPERGYVHPALALLLRERDSVDARVRARAVALAADDANVERVVVVVICDEASSARVMVVVSFIVSFGVIIIKRRVITIVVKQGCVCTAGVGLMNLPSNRTGPFRAVFHLESRTEGRGQARR